MQNLLQFQKKTLTCSEIPSVPKYSSGKMPYLHFLLFFFNFTSWMLLWNPAVRRNLEAHIGKFLSLEWELHVHLFRRWIWIALLQEWSQNLKKTFPVAAFVVLALFSQVDFIPALHILWCLKWSLER